MTSLHLIASDAAHIIAHLPPGQTPLGTRTASVDRMTRGRASARCGMADGEDVKCAAGKSMDDSRTSPCSSPSAVSLTCAVTRTPRTSQTPRFTIHVHRRRTRARLAVRVSGWAVQQPLARSQYRWGPWAVGSVATVGDARAVYSTDWHARDRHVAGGATRAARRRRTKRGVNTRLSAIAGAVRGHERSGL